MRGSYVDPRHGRATFESYAASWLELRPNLRPRTRELYEGQLRNHLLPTLGPVELAKLTPPVVRAWHAKLLNAGTISVTTAAKCYRLLKTILGTAVEDDKATVTVVASASELANGTRILGDPESYAGRRTVSIPAAIIPALVHHLEQFAEPGPDGVVFVGSKGGPLRRANFNTTWHALAREAQLEGLRFHDLRHTGNTLAAMTGASAKELMVRMGHSSARAALGYQHATEERERLIASRLSDMIDGARNGEA